MARSPLGRFSSSLNVRPIARPLPSVEKNSRETDRPNTRSASPSPLSTPPTTRRRASLQRGPPPAPCLPKSTRRCVDRGGNRARREGPLRRERDGRSHEGERESEAEEPRSGVPQQRVDRAGKPRPGFPLRLE